MRFSPPLPLFTSSRSKRSEDGERHRECRECGRNLARDLQECPRCGGTAVVFEVS
jgi:rRNA maturation endonuclease Nob1